MGWESFFLAAAERKGKKGKQNATEQDSRQTMTAMEGNLSSYGIAARIMEI